MIGRCLLLLAGAVFGGGWFCKEMVGGYKGINREREGERLEFASSGRRYIQKTDELPKAIARMIGE